MISGVSHNSLNKTQFPKSGCFDSENQPIRVKIQKTPKKFYCHFCKVQVSRFIEHMLSKHKDEEEVKKIKSLDPKSIDRKLLIVKLRAKAFKFYNENIENLTKGIMAKRVPEGIENNRKLKECDKCGKIYVKKNFYLHRRKCLVISKKIAQRYSDEEKMREVLKFGEKDEVYEVMSKDKLILSFGRELCILDTWHRKRCNEIRGTLRRLAKVLMACKKSDNTITDLKSLFDKKHWTLFVAVCKEFAGRDDCLGTYDSPSVAKNIGHSFKSCALKLSMELNLANHSMKKVEEWIFCYNQQFHTHVVRNCLLALEKKRHDDVEELPSSNDIKLLNDRIKEVMNDSIKKLKGKFSINDWKNLGRCLVSLILIFNRRRIGEMERLKVSDLKRKHVINKKAAYYQSLSTFEKALAGNFYRIPMMAKKQRKVFILVKKELYDNLELFLSLRHKAGVEEENDNVFALNERSELSAYGALDIFSKQCNAENPNTLRSTLLRKNIATFSSLLNMSENDMNNLATFMGHNFRIHSEFYKLPTEVTQLCHLSKLLVALDANEGEKYIGKSLDEIMSQDGDIVDLQSVLEGISEDGFEGSESSDNVNDDDNLAEENSTDSDTVQQTPIREQRSTMQIRISKFRRLLLCYTLFQN